MGISALNEMQEAAGKAIGELEEVVLLSPTGTGKTLAFILPLLQKMNENIGGLQLLILVPSRELGIQIEQVFRDIGSGYKVNLVYGGRRISKDKMELDHEPSILIGTPGRVADHIRRNTIDFRNTHIIVVDEYDKSLEIGFADEMEEIFESLLNIKTKVFTSATSGIEVPVYARSGNIRTLDFLDFQQPDLEIKRVVSPSKDKLDVLYKLLCDLGESSGIIFCNFKDSIDRISDFLSDHKISHVCFHGNLDQIERERALIKFRNGTERILLATDLAARGIDIPEMNYIIHYHLPLREEEFTHRNGRTARMLAGGKVFVIHWENDELPGFIGGSLYTPGTFPVPKPTDWCTVFISGGKKDKISKGDIAGFLFKEGQLSKNHVGLIELKTDCAFVAVHKSGVNQLISLVDNSRLKSKKVRLKIV